MLSPINLHVWQTKHFVAAKLLLECLPGAHYFHQLGYCYYVVETPPLPQADVDEACKDAYGSQAMILGLTRSASIDLRMELNFHMNQLNVDG